MNQIVLNLLKSDPKKLISRESILRMVYFNGDLFIESINIESINIVIVINNIDNKN